MDSQVLPESDYTLYGRQMIVPEIGLKGQQRLYKAKILVIGAGGLGSSAIPYLAGAGVGTLGIVDGDTVEVSNLHRQIIHSRATLGMFKAESAKRYVGLLNDRVQVKAWTERLTAGNAVGIFSQFDLVLDCTDTPMSRYLINDAAVVCGIPLVSASALKVEGQLAVYNYMGGPCYRCLFPVPPPAASVGTCGDSGIVGPVVGLMGVMQAIEALKIAAMDLEASVPTLTLYSALSGFRQMKVRPRQKACKVCGEAPEITLGNFGQQDYAEFCGSVSYPDTHSIEYREVQRGGVPLVDVRPAVQFGIVHVPGSTNVAMRDVDKHEWPAQVAVICRYGNDSRSVVAKLRARGVDAYSVSGGLRDTGLPSY